MLRAMARLALLACGSLILLASACSSSSSGNKETTDGGGTSDGTVDSASGHDATADGSGASDTGSTGDVSVTDATGGSEAASSDAPYDEGPPGDATSCGAGFSLCNGYCVNENNDILNCGGCGVRCIDTFPYCNNGSCTTAPCNPGSPTCSTGMFCCGSGCCGQGELCCDVPSNVPTTPGCYVPVRGTCPVGCPVCP